MSNSVQREDRSNPELSILTINGGSSSIKFAVFAATDPPTRRLAGKLDLQQSHAQFVISDEHHSKPQVSSIDVHDQLEASKYLIEFLDKHAGHLSIAGVGHRIVDGGAKLVENQKITPELLNELRRIQPLDLAHLPSEISLIEQFLRSYPNVPHIACFDTEFHRTMPRVASILPIPRHYYDAGVRRLGFHGLSYTYLMKKLKSIAGAEAANGRVILAHLGSGASMAAVHRGMPVDTTMAFTPNAGLVMGTRTGDIDPGVLVHLLRSEKLSARELDQLISQRSGLLGISETTSDMRELLSRRGQDQRAADAVDIFCYQARKFIGAFAAAMGGLDTLIFSGGIGERSPEIREQICESLSFLSLSIDAERNAANADVICRDNSKVTVRVMMTDEESVIADAVAAFLQ